MHADPQPQGAVCFRHQPKPNTMAGAGPWQHVTDGKHVICGGRKEQRDTQSAGGLRRHALLHLPVPGSCASPAWTDLEFQVWNRGNPAGQFTALSLGLAVSAGSSSAAALGPYVSWSCHHSHCICFLLERRPTAHRAHWVPYLLPDCPHTVSERAAENTPVLAAENLVLLSCCLSEGSFQSSGSAFSCLTRKITALVKL